MEQKVVYYCGKDGYDLARAINDSAESKREDGYKIVNIAYACTTGTTSSNEKAIVVYEKIEK